MDSNYKELRRNTIIIAIANMGSKLIMFILAPLYSYYMNTAEYGTMDLISTTVGLLVIVILQAVLYYIPGTASYIIRTIIVLSVLWKYRKVLLSVLKK